MISLLLTECFQTDNLSFKIIKIDYKLLLFCLIFVLPRQSCVVVSVGMIFIKIHRVLDSLTEEMSRGWKQNGANTIFLTLQCNRI